MDNKSNKKKEPWRMIVGIIAIVFIKMSGKTSEFNSGDESEYLILPP